MIYLQKIPKQIKIRIILRIIGLSFALTTLNLLKLFTVNNNDFMDLNYDITKDPKQIALKDIYDASQRSRTLEYKEKDINKSGISNYLFYIILAFVMVITIIVLYY